jgi:mono/diheme cytochrome c family protein
MSPPPMDFSTPEWTRRANAGLTFLAIRNGVRGTAMASWPTLTDRQTWELVAYIETLGSPQ